jgi:LuxR family maltose regulon positive regulatory protein
LGDRDKALIALECALSMGEPEGFIRSFIDQGFPMEELLKKAIAVGIHVRYSIQLLTAFRTDTQPVILETKNPPSVDELTKREKEVLHLLATGLPLSDIADGLVITIGTLRTHIKRIYDKLDAHSRFEAVTKWKDYILH